MEAKKYGITNLMPIIMTGVELGNVADKMGHTKGMSRYMHATSLFDEIVSLGNVDFKQVKLEIKDLDETEIATIKNEIKVKFDIIDDNLEGIIEESIDIVEDAYSIIDRSTSLVKKIKALKAA